MTVITLYTALNGKFRLVSSKERYEVGNDMKDIRFNIYSLISHVFDERCKYTQPHLSWIIHSEQPYIPDKFTPYLVLQHFMRHRVP